MPTQLSFDLRPVPDKKFRIPKGIVVVNPLTGEDVRIGGRWAKPVRFGLDRVIFLMDMKGKSGGIWSLYFSYPVPVK